MAKTSFFTGPTIVKQIAAKMREAGINVACEGTEHVWVEAEGVDSWNGRFAVLETLRAKFGTDFGLR